MAVLAGNVGGRALPDPKSGGGWMLAEGAGVASPVTFGPRAERCIAAGRVWCPVGARNISAGERLVRSLRVRSRRRFPAISARYACIVANGEPEVPVDVEEYLAWLSASSGQWGRAVDLAGTDSAAAVRYLDQAAARAAARLRMKVEERTGDGPGTAEQVKARLMATFPDARVAPLDDGLRLTVPVPVTRARRIVLDVEFGTPTESRVPVRLRGFGMEGRRSREPTRDVTDRAWAAITSDGT